MVGQEDDPFPLGLSNFSGAMSVKLLGGNSYLPPTHLRSAFFWFQENQVTQLFRPHRTNSFRTSLNCTFFHLGCRTKAAGRSTQQKCFFSKQVHPWSLTWNLKKAPWKRRSHLESIIFRFYVKLQGCTPFGILALGQNYPNHKIHKSHGINP